MPTEAPPHAPPPGPPAEGPSAGRQGVARVARLLAPAMRPPLWRYCLLAWVAAQVPAGILGGLASLVAHAIGFDPIELLPRLFTPDAVGLLILAVAGPLVETGLLLVLLWALVRAGMTDLRASATAAVLWGGLHGLSAPLWFFSSAWLFFVFSWSALYWRRVSRRHAFVAAWVPHALGNLVAGGLLSLSG